MKRPNPHKLPPDFRSREDRSFRRDHRLVIYLNAKEMEVLKRYQEILGGKKSRASICRESIIQTVLKGLNENQPTLF